VKGPNWFINKKCLNVIELTNFEAMKLIENRSHVAEALFSHTALEPKVEK